MIVVKVLLCVANCFIYDTEGKPISEEIRKADDKDLEEFWTNLQEYAKRRPSEECGGCISYTVTRNGNVITFEECYNGEVAYDNHCNNHIKEFRDMKDAAKIGRGFPTCTVEKWKVAKDGTMEKFSK
jgi:quinol monooxygenase YgiN